MSKFDRMKRETMATQRRLGLELVLGTMAAYVVAFESLYFTKGAGMCILSVVPVTVTAWLVGLWAGLLAGLLAFPLNILLLNMVGYTGWDATFWAQTVLGHVAVILIGAMVGRLRDLGERVKKEFNEHKKAEKEKERIQAQLFQAQKMEVVGTLAGGIAHDFKTMLTIIQGYSDLSMKRVDEADPVHRFLKQIHKTTERGVSLSRQLLLFSRKQPMEFAPLNINRRVNDLLKMLSNLIVEDITINTDLESDLWTVQADKGNIEQVIMNLTLNARDAMPNGGKLTIKTENVTLNEEQCKVLPEARSGQFVCLSVADTGVGMDKETIQRVFEPFFSTKKAGKGIGLGLSTVYGIIKQHKGWINVDSEPGKGSIFKLYLPAYFTNLEDETKGKISSMKV